MIFWEYGTSIAGTPYFYIVVPDMRHFSGVQAPNMSHPNPVPGQQSCAQATPFMSRTSFGRPNPVPGHLSGAGQDWRATAQQKRTGKFVRT